MSSEKDFLQSDLSNLEENKDTVGLEQLAKNASLLGHEDIAEKARESIQKISDASSSAESNTPTQITQVENLGGSEEEIESRTREVDQKIEDVKTEATQQIEAVSKEIAPVIVEVKNDSEINEISPEIQREINNLDLLKKEKIRLQNRIEEVRKEYKDNFQLLSKRQLTSYESDIRDMENKVLYLIPNKIEDTNQKIEQLTNQNQPLEKEQAPKIETIDDKIQSASSLPELYKIIRSIGKLEGSSEVYTAEQIWERVRAYINNEADERVVTRTGGLREKVKELKKLRVQEKQAVRNEGEQHIKKVTMEEWKSSLPDVHSMAEFSFRDFSPEYYIDSKGDHYVIYTEDGKRQGRKLYVAAQNAGMSVRVEPNEIEKTI